MDIDADGLKFDADEPEDKPEEFWNQREIIVYAVDCTSQMFQPDADGKTYFGKCLQGLKSLYMNKIIGMSNDIIGVVFYGTSVDDPSQSKQHIRTFWEPKPADRDVVKKLEAMIRSDTFSDFDNEYGHSDNYSLADVLWHCSSLITKCKVKMHYKKIVLMTCNDNPHAGLAVKQHQARKKAEDLEGLGITLDLISLGGTFDGEVFYKELLEIVNHEQVNFEEIKVKIEELETRVYRKDTKKRCVSKLSFAISKNVAIAVEMYNFYRPLRVPPLQKLDRKSNETLKSVTQTYNCETGERLLKSDIIKCMEIAGKRVTVTVDEMKKFTEADKPLITLLGFKSFDYLPVEYHRKGSSFIYAADQVVKGSTTLFKALLLKCIERQKFALCAMISRAGGRLSLVALMPQEERKVNGVQEMPPGFHVVYLPYADNIRDVPVPKKAEVSDDQVELWKKILKKLRRKYEVQTYENPKVQVHWASIEALALEYKEPRDVIDRTMPDYDFASERLGELETEFRNEFMPLGYNPEDALSKKRKYPASNNYVPKVMKYDRNEPRYVENMIRDGLIAKLTISDLNNWLVQQGKPCPRGLKKADLMNLVCSELGHVNP